MPPAPARPVNTAQVSPVEQAVLQLRGALGQMYHTLTRTRQKVYALEAASRLRDAGRSPAFPVEFRSQYGEDLLLYDLFEGRQEGFFVEVGAFDGYNYSVTYSLEAMGWKGLLVEAIPEKAKACAERRVNARVVHAALGRRGSTGEAEFTVTTDPFGGMLSYHTTTAQHLRDTQPAPKTVVRVPLTTMDDLLAQTPPPGGEIDVAVIDVAGGEVALLQGFDLHRHRPKVMLVEDITRGADPTLREYMSTQPYVMCGWLEVNAVFIRADLTEHQRRIARIFRA